MFREKNTKKLDQNYLYNGAELIRFLSWNNPGSMHCSWKGKPVQIPFFRKRIEWNVLWHDISDLKKILSWFYYLLFNAIEQVPPFWELSSSINLFVLLLTHLTNQGCNRFQFGQNPRNQSINQSIMNQIYLPGK